MILHRLKEKGIGGKLGCWIKSFLENRTQIVIANNVASRPTMVQSGVPQGSVLGPLLFLILIDSLTDNGTSSHIGIFTDDTRITHEIASEIDAIDLQADLESLYEWAKLNNMEFNGSKFEAMKCGKNSLISYQQCGKATIVTSARWRSVPSMPNYLAHGRLWV